ncbi:MAG: hypothetical protein WAP37_01830, partial [Solirubrobacterales bacterium]
AVVSALAACGDDAPAANGAKDPASADPGPVHVHGLGVNPADGALFLATHTGVWRLPDGSGTATRVSDRQQDTMGFDVVGPDHFIASGHPDLSEDLPPFLGFIESSDAARTWRQTSLSGEADFHVLEASGRRVYGFGSDFRSRSEQLLVSDDNGESWAARDYPEPFLSLAINPDDPVEALASGERKLHLTTDGGRSWKSIPGEPGLLVWNQRAIFRIDEHGSVTRAARPGAKWTDRGTAAGRPAAFDSGGDDLFVALHDGVVKQSPDGTNWKPRYRP